MKTKADRMNIDAVLGGDVTPPVTTFQEADQKDTPAVNKGGRPIKGRGKAVKKIAFHVDEATWAQLESMIKFPQEKSVNAVAKRILEGYIEPLMD